MISLAKVHDRPEGTLVLVDRLWPRGIARADFQPALWPKGATPSSELRKEFHSGALDFEQFSARYAAELDEALEAGNADVLALIELARKEDVVLVFASKNRDRNHAHVLAQWLEEHL